MENGRADVAQVFGVTRFAAVIVDDGLEIVSGLRKLGVVLLGPEERTERVIVPDMKPNLDGGPAVFGGTIDFAVEGLLAVGPKFLTGDQFRVFDQQAPE